MLDAYPILTLLPPLIAIVLVIATRKVLISLGAGIVAAGLLIAEFNPLTALVTLWEAILGLVWVDGEGQRLSPVYDYLKEVELLRMLPN